MQSSSNTVARVNVDYPENRDRRDNGENSSGWRSWFGLGDNKKDDDREYKYTSTYNSNNNYSRDEPRYTTSWDSSPSTRYTRESTYEQKPEYYNYRGDNYRGYLSDNTYRSTYQPSRPYGGMEFSTTFRPSTSVNTYGPEPRPVNYSSDYSRPTTYERTSPSKSYGYEATYTTGSRPYTSESTSRDYPVSTYSRDYPTTTYGRDTCSRDMPTSYGYSRDTTYTRDVPSTSYGYSTSRDTTRDYPSTSYGYNRDAAYGRDTSYSRDYPTTSSSYGYNSRDTGYSTVGARVL